jgi:hypothetical protein
MNWIAGSPSPRARALASQIRETSFPCHRSAALRQCEQVIVPVSVGLGPHGVAVRAVDDPDVGALAVDEREKGVRAALDRIDHLLPCPFPRGAAEVRNPLMGVVSRLFFDARYPYVCHQIPFLDMVAVPLEPGSTGLSWGPIGTCGSGRDFGRQKIIVRIGRVVRMYGQEASPLADEGREPTD